jgi:primosomal protein N' (replication factor Y)
MKVASVVFASPLPQLDKEFDYLIPEELEAGIKLGVQVEVPFGSGKKPKTGIVVGIDGKSDFTGKLLEVNGVTSPLEVLSREQYKLAQAVASRQAGIVGELLSSAIPKRSKRAEAKFVLQSSADLSTNDQPVVTRQYLTPAHLDGDKHANWAIQFIELLRPESAKGRSVLVVLPDYRSVGEFEAALEANSLSRQAFRQSSSDGAIDRWTNHLHAVHQEGLIVYGTRGAAFAPCKNLGLILIWDDGDDSHHEQSSPYWNSRDVLLQRSELENVSIVFSSHSPSAEVSRLVEIGYLSHIDHSGAKPLVRVTQGSERLDQETFALVSKTLKNNSPVLIQIANLGFATALVCTSCKEVQRCVDCQTALWLDPAKVIRCRGCKRAYGNLCKCGGKNFRATSQGSHALTEQLARSFPESVVLTSTGSERITRVERKGILVIATPGAEPSVDGGYEAIILADAQKMLGYPRLRALEQACQKWANALAHLAQTGIGVVVGLTGVLADQVRDLAFMEIVGQDMLERTDLGLPPATRLMSITGANTTDLESLKTKLSSLEELHQIPTSNGKTVAYTFSIANGSSVANDVRLAVSQVTKESRNRLPGQRLLFINMDDQSVI